MEMRLVPAALALSLSVAGGAVGEERPVVPPVRPAEYFCLPGDQGGGGACVALFLDEDGYELCLVDRLADTERCLSYYRLEPDEDDRGERDTGLSALPPAGMPWI
ncbi:hypothetical protein HFC70_20360 [Agrobacterium sp. a22-2]|uniref:hypothetical protein n=1 Tax=Agrobacterium sp. a22-2 TaxID=2283840 RepID=UPI001444C000|nr:hypothetical protein [Agrobacterium sp. a22-2]NKN38709.1 hypothetical protein [Agrobacterium sp. a22-2]